MSQAQNRIDSLMAFVPSYRAQSIQLFRELTRQALASATDPANGGNLTDAINRDPQASKYDACETLSAVHGWLSFGHLSRSDEQTSGRCLAKVTAKFSLDVLNEISITLVLYNVQFIISERGFRPAIVDKNQQYEVVGTDETVGLRLLLTETQSGMTDDAAIFVELTDGVSVNPPVPTIGNWRPIEPGALRSRVDVSMNWKRKGKDFSHDDTGAIATTGASAIGDKRVALVFWSPISAARFSGVLHESDRFGLSPTDARGYLTKTSLVLSDHGTIGDTAALTKAKQQFGLGSDFRGLIFGGLGAHWLDDGLMGADIIASESSAAVSFHEPSVGNSPARLYVSVNAKVNPSNRGSYLSILKDGAQLKLSVAGAKLRLCSLSATFKDIAKDDNPFGWLSGRKAVMTLQSMGASGAGSREHYKLDITLDEVKAGRLATLTAASLGVDPIAFSYLASVLTLAPILKLAGGKVQASKGAKDERVRFVEIAAGDLTGALFAAKALDSSWFFKTAIHADELRVTGIRLLSQPRDSGRETALLFDVETDFAVSSADLPLKSSKAMSVRVENTGLLESSGKIRWVQAAQGVLELKVLDASAWDFGGLSGLLAVKRISFELAELPFVHLTLGLSLNLGVVSADDFKVTINLKSPGKDIEFYPSAFHMDVGGVVKGEGTLDLGSPGHALDAVAGSLDLQVLAGIRMAGAVQIIKVEDDGKGAGPFTAVGAGARVQWPTGIPLGASGLQIMGFEALYTTHLKRLENNDVAGIPPSLDWLQRAKGDVAIGAISDKQLWTPDYDHWSFGAGALLTPVAAGSLTSFNALIVLELPGPKIIGFINVAFLEEPKSNHDKKDKLTIGILGILEIDFVARRLRVGASLNLRFSDFLTLNGSMDAEWAVGSLSKWHLYIGHFRRPNQAKLTLGSLVSVGSTGYFMVAGDRIEAVPSGSEGIRDLPGLALAMGATSYVTLGSGLLYLRMKMQMFLNISLGKNIYASGELELSGELYIFIGGIGASGGLDLEYCDDGNQIYLRLSGKLCGHIRIGFMKIGGCVGATIGGQFPNKIRIPKLVNKVSLVSGTNVALFGQGALSQIDEVITAISSGGTPDAITGMPLDSVIAIALECAPALQGKAGFLGRLQAAADNTLFNYGGKPGGYVLTDVTLYKLNHQDMPIPINHVEADAVWWRNPQSSGDRHAIPMELALLTRSPFAAPNAVASPETIRRWIEALSAMTGVCNTLAPQLSFNLFPRRSVSGENLGARLEWKLTGRFRSSEIEQALATAGRQTLKASIEQRPGYGSLNDSLVGFPRFLGTVQYEEPPQASEQISVMALSNFPERMDVGPTALTLTCAGMAPVAGSQGVIMMLLIASRDIGQLRVEAACRDTAGASISILDPKLQSSDNFHEGSTLWSIPVNAFSSLDKVPGYGSLQFAVLTISLEDIGRWNEMTPPAELHVKFLLRTRADQSLKIYVAGSKYLSIEEYRRHNAQKAFNDGVIEELTAYLKPRPAPVLEPNSRYRLDLNWETVGSDIIHESRIESYAFTTDVNPPRKLDPYLIGTYPPTEARFHSPGQQFGLSLASGDILKLLAKFKGAALKITVTEDGNNPVSGFAGQHTIDWGVGRTYLPGDLLNLAVDPVGLTRKPFRALPSALLRAIKLAMASDALRCIDKNIMLDQGLWLGIEADLEPLRGYTVTLTIVDTASGQPWFGDSSAPFFRWHFRTGLHRDTKAHSVAFSRSLRRSRMLQSGAFVTPQALTQALDAIAKPQLVSEEYKDTDLAGNAPPVSSEKLFVVDDQLLENVLTLATGARSLLDGEVETLLIWTGTIERAEVIAIIMKSREPMTRRTPSVQVRTETDGLNTAEVLHREDVTTRYPSFDQSQAVERLYLASSGTSIVVIPDHAKLEALGHLTVPVVDRPPYYLPYADVEISETFMALLATEMSR